jgi:hypothetical protein
MYKDGAVVKVRRKPVPVFRKFYVRTLRKMLKDLGRLEGMAYPDASRFGRCQTFVEEGDARNLRIDSEFIDLVITSPPYLNKIEYTRIYGVEEYLFFGRPLEKRGMRSYMGLETGARPVLPGEGLPATADAYLADMKKSLSELRRVCKTGAVLCFIIGDGCFAELGRVVRMDHLLPKIADAEGFETGGIQTLNERWCTRRRVQKVARMGEHLIVMRKR